MVAAGALAWLCAVLSVRCLVQDVVVTAPGLGPGNSVRAPPTSVAVSTPPQIAAARPLHTTGRLGIERVHGQDHIVVKADLARLVASVLSNARVGDLGVALALGKVGRAGAPGGVVDDALRLARHGRRRGWRLWRCRWWGQRHGRIGSDQARQWRARRRDLACTHAMDVGVRSARAAAAAAVATPEVGGVVVGGVTGPFLGEADIVISSRAGESGVAPDILKLTPAGRRRPAALVVGARAAPGRHPRHGALLRVEVVGQVARDHRARLLRGVALGELGVPEHRRRHPRRRLGPPQRLLLDRVGQAEEEGVGEPRTLVPEIH